MGPRSAAGQRSCRAMIRHMVAFRAIAVIGVWVRVEDRVGATDTFREGAMGWVMVMVMVEVRVVARGPVSPQP